MFEVMVARRVHRPIGPAIGVEGVGAIAISNGFGEFGDE